MQNAEREAPPKEGEERTSGGLPRPKPEWEILPPCIFVVVLQKWQKTPARKLGRPLYDIYLRGVSSPLAVELGE